MTFLATDLPYVQAGYGIKTPYGIILPPGARVAAYVRSTGLQDGDDPNLATNLVATLSAGLARVRAGFGDTVVCLPGHSESVADALMLTNLVAGTRVLGWGRGSNMPVFRWTATGAQWPINKADCTFAGLRLRLEGANGVVKGILATAADVGIYGCDVEVASGATAKATIAIEVGAGADRFEFRGNVVRGTATHNVTDLIKVVSAVDQVRIVDNEMLASATAANGLVHFTAAALNVKVGRNIMYNSHTASSACIVFDAVAADGVAWDNKMAVLNNGTASAQGITFGAGCLIRSFQNFCSDEAVKSGLLAPVAAT